MYQKSRDHIKQIKNLDTTLNIRLKFRDQIEQIKSLWITLKIRLKFIDCLCHYPLIIIVQVKYREFAFSFIRTHLGLDYLTDIFC